MKIYNLLSMQIRKENGKKEIGQTTRMTTLSFQEVKREHREVSEYRIKKLTKLYNAEVLRHTGITTEIKYKKDGAEILNILKIIENKINIPEF